MEKEAIHIVKTEDGKYMCDAYINGEHYGKLCDDILMAAAWAETVADWSIRSV